MGSKKLSQKTKQALAEDHTTLLGDPNNFVG